MASYETHQRNELIALFQENMHVKFSAKQIYEILKQRDISKSTIYRNISELEKQGLIARVNDKNKRDVFYRYIDPNKCLGIIHLMCSSCGSTFHANKELSQAIVESTMDAIGFKIKLHDSTLIGTCKDCL